MKKIKFCAMFLLSLCCMIGAAACNESNPNLDFKNSEQQTLVDEEIETPNDKAIDADDRPDDGDRPDGSEKPDKEREKEKRRIPKKLPRPEDGFRKRPPIEPVPLPVPEPAPHFKR